MALNLDIFTLFPEAFDWLRGQRPVRKAIESGAGLQVRGYRDWTPLKGGRVDDAPMEVAPAWSFASMSSTRP